MAEFRAIHERVGKYTHGNPISFPAGSAKVAENYNTIRDNVYEKPRGRAAYGTGLPAQNIVQIMEYQKRVHLHLGNNNIWYDSDGLGTFHLLAGSILAPDATTLMRDLEFSAAICILQAPQGLKYSIPLEVPQWTQASRRDYPKTFDLVQRYRFLQTYIRYLIGMFGRI